MYKQGQRKLTVKFPEDSSDNIISIVEDNGIGRIASQKRSSREAHTGKGLTVAEERIKTFNEQHTQKSSFVIDDLHDESGNATGTRVTLLLPLIK